MTPPNVNTPWFLQLIFNWIEHQPIVGTLVCLMLADTACGVCLAMIRGSLNSSASWRGVCRKAIMLLIVGSMAGVQPLVPTVPMLQLVSLFFVLTELISLLEHAGAAGVPLPQGLIDALSKLRDQRVATALQKAASTVNNVTVVTAAAPVVIESPAVPAPAPAPGEPGHIVTPLVALLIKAAGIALALTAMTGCQNPDTAFRSRVSSASTSVGVTHAGDVGVTETLTFRDPSKDR